MVVPCVEHRGRVGETRGRVMRCYWVVKLIAGRRGPGGIARINFTWWEDDRLLGERAREGARQRDMEPRR